MVAMSVSGCVTGVTSCPEPTPIPKELQIQAANELDTLPSGSAIENVLVAALIDREKLRACRNIR